MRCPFPGMDPYIERPEIWPDFRSSLTVRISGALQGLLRPRYVALIQHRTYCFESDQPISHDFAVIRTSTTIAVARHATAVTPDLKSPAVFQLWREEINEPVIHIVEPAAANRVITAIEVLSPSNKSAGPGRESYLKKREEFWEAGTNLVEIDLLREGEPTVRVSAEELAALDDWRYLVAVTRRWPSRQQVYAMPLQKRLPRVDIPLAYDHEYVKLDLQAAFTRCWDEGPYPELLRYDGSLPGAMSPTEKTWCEAQLRMWAGLPK